MDINKKKVLIACNSSRTLLGFRGKLIEELVRNNEVHISTPVICHVEVTDTLRRLNVIVHENGMNGSNVSIISDLKYILELYKLISRIKPDIFFPYTFKPIIYGTTIAKICKVACITPLFSGLGYNFSNHEVKKTIISRITRNLLKWSLGQHDHLKIIFQNKDDYQNLIESRIIGLKHKAFVVNGSGVDLTHYDYSVPKTEDITFLMIARLINAKGIKEFYEAAKLVREKFPNVRFKLIGPYGDNIDSINKELYNCIIKGNIVEYLGEIDDVRPHIKEASILVLPSYYGEGVPRCILEGMAMGRAIITCDSVGCRETINDSLKKPNGFLIPVKNVSALADKMEHYIGNTKDILAYGLNGREFARQKFDVNLINAEMLKIMQIE